MKKSDYEKLTALLIHELEILNECTKSKTITKPTLIKIIRKSHAKMTQMVDDTKFRDERFAAISFLNSLDLVSTKVKP